MLYGAWHCDDDDDDAGDDEQGGFLEVPPSTPSEWEAQVPPGQAGGDFSGQLLNLGRSGVVQEAVHACCCSRQTLLAIELY